MKDLIDRQQAIDELMENVPEVWKDDDYELGMRNQHRSDVGIIEALPSVQPRKKGRWIYGESEEGNDGYFCSQCGNFVPWIYKEFDIDFIKEFKFCPSCGADMRGDEDE